MADVPIRSGKALAGLVAVVALLASTVTVVLADSFSDVPSGNFFAPSIDDITDAGCAGGYPNGTFKPKENPTREQFALWAGNCFSRSAGATDPNVAGIDTTYDQIDNATMDVAGFDGKTQYLHVAAWYTLNEEGSECPCDISLRIRVRESNSSGTVIFTGEPVTANVEEGAGSDIDDTLAGVWRIPVPTDAQYYIESEGEVFNNSSGSCSNNNCLTLADSALTVWHAGLNNGTTGISSLDGVDAETADDDDGDAVLDPTGNPNG